MVNAWGEIRCLMKRFMETCWQICMLAVVCTESRVIYLLMMISGQLRTRRLKRVEENGREPRRGSPKNELTSKRIEYMLSMQEHDRLFFKSSLYGREEDETQ